MSQIETELTPQQLLHRILEKHRKNIRPLPSKNKAQQWIDRLIDILFPVRCVEVPHELEIRQLELQLWELLLPIENEIHSVDTTIKQFFSRVPFIYDALQNDAQAILAFDPAAHSIEEVVAAYPGFYAISVYRFSHELYKLKIPILPRMISEYAHSQTGIDINPGLNTLATTKDITITNNFLSSSPGWEMCVNLNPGNAAGCWSTGC